MLVDVKMSRTFGKRFVSKKGDLLLIFFLGFQECQQGVLETRNINKKGMVYV